MVQIVVDRSSATSMCNQGLYPLNKNHVDLVKPCDANDDSYIVLKKAVAEISR
jgi:hypothetical protein